ncbi:hypothetical protein ACPOL_2268 [Acidisarcina polymorpha]|uniref:Uncharacterized protein n=1 Tax=Acidisarcina polymorpha TaxID=2211140 RepID=A0A2Z5FXR7_9BACT|nr:hypothetical protein ACPOL_2268 [Acidisarcina polymorpha]
MQGEVLSQKPFGIGTKAYTKRRELSFQRIELITRITGLRGVGK